MAKTTIDDVLEAVNNGFTSVEGRLTGVENRLTGVETRLTGVETRLTGVEATMVTKDYLDEKLGVVNGKFSTLVNVLKEKRVLTDVDKRRIHS